MSVAGEPARAAGALDAVLAAVARRRRLETALRGVLEGAGYVEAAVPLLQPAASGDGWEAAYRVLDPDGALMDLRPDVTGPVARMCAVGDAGGPRPRRLWYQATIFRRAAGRGAREIPQAGAERIGGDGGVAADVEVLGLAAACLRAAGAESLLLALGDVDYVRQCATAAGVDPRRVLATLRARDLAGLPACAGAAAADLAWRGDVQQALVGGVRDDLPGGRRLRGLLREVDRIGLAGSVLVEPGLVLAGGYYTGLVFEAVVPGAPAPVGDGGRYDGLLGRWGRGEPAVGFALDCDRLVAALDGEAPGDGARRAWAAVAGSATGGAGPR